MPSTASSVPERLSSGPTGDGTPRGWPAGPAGGICRRPLASSSGPERLGKPPAARGAFAWRLIDAELAGLVAGSACELVYAGPRGGGPPRLVTFEVPGGTSLELEAGSHGGGIRLIGQVVPARPGTAEVQHPG